MTHADTLPHALTAAARGWHVHPLRPGAKAPLWHGWEQRATTDPDLIRAIWIGPCNIGIATGPSGLVVIDLDTTKNQTDAPDGATALRALSERADQPVTRTFTVRTPSGGWHLYYTAPPDARLHNTAGTLAPHVDTRAWGGYVVAPGSTIDGTVYQVVRDVPVAPLPTWLLHLLQPTAPATVRPPAPLLRPGQSTRRAAVALDREAAAVAATGEGGRNARLLAGARALGRFVAWGEIDQDAVEEAFQGAGETAGLPAAECRATIHSALTWSIRTCRPQETA